METYSNITTHIGNIRFKLLPSNFSASPLTHTSVVHSHGTYEFHVTSNGELTISLEEQTFVLKKTQSILIPPNVPHSKSPSKDNPQYIALRFSAEKIPSSQENDYFSVLQEFANEKNGFAKSIQQNPLILQYSQNIQNCVKKNAPFAKEKVASWVKLLFTEMLLPLFNTDINHSVFVLETSDHDAIINAISGYFNTQYHEDITLTELSTLLHMSKTQTQRIIQNSFGASFRECLSKIRLNTAKTLLRETNMEVQDIAATVGYRSYNGFYLAFKSKFELTPLEYRQRKQRK